MDQDKYIYHYTTEIQLWNIQEISQSGQVNRGVSTWTKSAMNKDDPNVKDGKGKIEEDTEKLLKDDPERKNEEDTKEKLKGDHKGKIEEDSKKMLKDEPKEGSSFVKRKPPKELLKGGLRDRSLFSWLRILGWI